MPHAKRIAWKVHYQLHLDPCKFFLVEMNNVVRMHDKMELKLYFKST